MCGIVGYIGFRNGVQIVLEGLRRLEYRGYDSAGLALKNLEIIKVKGKISDLEPLVKNKESDLVIGHTRWATHGEPSKINAHPHFDKDQKIAIVHNGIIENHYDLRRQLEKKYNIEFKTQTDSEIIAHLISVHYKDNFEEAFVKMLDLIEGAFGIVAMHKDHDFLICAKKGSPLIIGVGGKEYFVASDATPFLEYTRDVIDLDDKQYAIITRNKVEIKNFEGFNLNKEVTTVDLKIEAIQKGGFKHFMLKEIFEQPITLEHCFKGKVKNIDNITINSPEKMNRIILLACGTSWHSALIGQYLFEKRARQRCRVEYGSEFRYRDPVLDENDFVVALSQSGETADTLEAIKLCKKAGCSLAGIVNTAGSAIAKTCEQGIYLHAGPEIGVASTKAFTSQIMALNLLNLHFIKDKEYRKKVIKEIELLPQKVYEFILDYNDDIREISKHYKDANNFLFLGRDINFPVALEGALKLKEISYIHAEGYPAAEMKHGPIALIDENMPVVFIINEDSVFDKVISNMQEVKTRKGKIIAVASKVNDEIKRLSDHIIEVPSTIWELSPIINIIPLQLLAYHIADLRGCEIDQPRNLAKSVTVE